MPRPEKVQVVAEIKERLDRAQAVFLAEYAGLSVKQQQTLRRGLREGGAEFKVVKMSLARRAAAELEMTDLDELFLGPTGIAFADGDPVSAAKALKEFAKENESFILKGGLLDGGFLTPERISELAEIESREVLLSKIAGVMKAPMANLAGLLAALPRNLASAMQQLAEKKEEAGDTSGAEATAPAVEADADASVEEASDADADASADAPEEAPAVAEAEEVSGETVAADAEAVDAEATVEEEPAEAAAETEDAPAAPEASAEEEADADGDDAKSVDEDPAEKAEEE